MINVIIYLNKEHNPMELVKFLLTEELISAASIDENNLSYSLSDSGFSEVLYNVITAQSKSLLFNNLVNAIENKIGREIPICSTPIVGSNRSFDDAVRTHTKLI